MRSLTVATAIFAPLLAAGCMATVSNEGYAPELAYAAPGVQVIVDYDEPIFFADSFYWRFYGGGWYRSPHHNGGWVYATPPPAVRGINRPQTYVHYRPAGWAGHRERAPQQPVARGPRDNQPGFEPRRGEPAPRPMYQQPQPRPAQPPPQWNPRAQQPLPRPPQGQPPPRAVQPGPRDRDRRGDQGSHDHRDDGDHRDHH